MKQKLIEKVEELRLRPHRHRQRVAITVSAAVTGLIAVIWLVGVSNTLPDFSKNTFAVDVLTDTPAGASAIDASQTEVVTNSDGVTSLEQTSVVNSNNQNSSTGAYPERKIQTIDGSTQIVPASDGSIELKDNTKNNIKK